MRQMDDKEVEESFQEIVDAADEEAEFEEWIKTHGFLEFQNYYVGADSIASIRKRTQIIQAYLERLMVDGVELEVQVTEDATAVLAYPDEETRNRYEL